jgi:hypothetical protein
MDLSADANHRGFPQISAPTLSATYSLLRLIAIWINEAAKGARIIIAIKPMNPILLFLRPPKNIAKLANIEMAPAKVAATTMMVVSLFLIWASSWAITAAISF